jgi:diaminohydroxyphosphoribosylaminopyrimidine deaminase / 5-amino-6-(5-phosphoribosylamino)uracil reductase
VGVGTVLADDPDLTCRLPGFRQGPLVRVVADTRLRTPPTARLFADRASPVWLLTASPDPSRRAALQAQGAQVMPLATPPPLAGEGRGEGAARAALAALGAAGLTSILVEGGATLAASLLRAGLVDRLAWFHAPALMGGDGLPALAGTGLDRLSELPRFRRVSATPLGDDMLTEYERTV